VSFPTTAGTYALVVDPDDAASSTPDVGDGVFRSGGATWTIAAGLDATVRAQARSRRCERAARVHLGRRARHPDRGDADADHDRHTARDGYPDADRDSDARRTTATPVPDHFTCYVSGGSVLRASLASRITRCRRRVGEEPKYPARRPTRGPARRETTPNLEGYLEGPEDGVTSVTVVDQFIRAACRSILGVACSCRR
jgi:hypothetical protein